ncbi:CBS domain-containing protein [Pedosphaera parvula]|uniref:Putative signal transduction protein with CBS domains n=1 Tax=Pedosphaera parvula (strain Ellin514) TaxID=320771 RepID=B9XMQ1_PEDPL|nr:CBS domain-containing protein [Pedosphaera parvula]EEF58826.1 putative signal transduction protein with CBS domains [Pedosphaera parvula Ellin514]
MNISGTIDSILNYKGKQIWSIQPFATVYEAVEKMAEKNVGALLVMENDRLVGMFSERDYTRKVVLHGKSSRQTLVREIISRPVISVDPDCSVEEAMRIMTENRIRHLPVIESDQVVGVVSIGDLVNWMISAQHLALNQMEDYITGKYPG